MASALAAAVGFIALALVGLVGWHRTRDLRTGSVRAAPTTRGGTGTPPGSSWTTWLAACTAVAVGLAAVTNLAGGWPMPKPMASLVLAWSAVAAISGFRARVTAVSATASGVTIRYARRRPFEAAWTDVTGIAPPRWPMGCWRVQTVTGSRTLMPSDLLGAEDVVREAVRRRGLSFNRRAWSG